MRDGRLFLAVVLTALVCPAWAVAVSPNDELELLRDTQTTFRSVAEAMRPYLVKIETVGGSQPRGPATVDPDDDTIYVGSDEDPGGKILAVNPDSTLRWKFSTDTNDVNSTPAVDPNSKIVYAGSDDRNLYAVNQVAEPRSYRTEQYEEKKVVSTDDFASISFTDSDNWLQEGPWAVRMEITRDTVASEGVYVLKAWLEKCSDSNCSTRYRRARCKVCTNTVGVTLRLKANSSRRKRCR